MAFEWSEINYMQIDASKNIWNNLIFPLAVVFVFLVLAAQYESWALPLAVLLVVPMCILGSLTGVWLTHGDINIFTQIGFVVLVGHRLSACRTPWLLNTPTQSPHRGSAAQKFRRPGNTLRFRHS